MKKIIEESISESARIINSSVTLSGNIEKSILEITKTLRNGKKIILFGNGGSAADAQHIAAELIGRFKLKRNSLPAISLTMDCFLFKILLIKDDLPTFGVPIIAILKSCSSSSLLPKSNHFLRRGSEGRDRPSALW